MTQIGEGVAAGAGKDSKGPDLEDNHWLELEYLYQNGTPLYGTYRATDSEGMEWNGRLNDQGQVCLAGLPDGKVQVDLLPETSDDKALEATRLAIQKVLHQIIADQKAEADEYERDLENLGGPRRVYQHIHKVGESVWNAALGVVELAETATHKLVEISNFLHPVNLLGDNLKAAYKSYQDGELTREQWYDSINQNLKDEHQKELARIFGIEPDDLSKERLQELMALIAEAYDVAAFIADDSETQAMLKQFAKDMAATQHSMEWAEFSGAVVFELILAASLAVFTAGIGTAAQAGTKLRHTAEMRKLAPLFRKLAEQLRNKKLNKQVDVPVDTPTTTKTDQPDIIELDVRGRTLNGAEHSDERASLTLSESIDELYMKAPAAKREIDEAADAIAAMVDGRVAKAPVKSRERTTQKILEDYGGDTSRIKDVVRNTIIVQEDKVETVIAELNRRGAKIKVIDGASDPLGYSGVNSSLKTQSGLVGEIQVNTPEMIYAKESESLARELLGEDLYEATASKVGVPGGKGHELYERWRSLPRSNTERSVIEAKSKSYYNAVRRSNNGG